MSLVVFLTAIVLGSLSFAFGIVIANGWLIGLGLVILAITIILSLLGEGDAHEVAAAPRHALAESEGDTAKPSHE